MRSHDSGERGGTWEVSGLWWDWSRTERTRERRKKRKAALLQRSICMYIIESVMKDRLGSTVVYLLLLSSSLALWLPSWPCVCICVCLYICVWMDSVKKPRVLVERRKETRSLHYRHFAPFVCRQESKRERERETDPTLGCYCAFLSFSFSSSGGAVDEASSR